MIAARFQALMSGDVRNVQRDPMLRWFVLIPIGVALLMRFGVPLLNEVAAARWGFTLEPYDALIASFYLFLMPGLVGMVSGFLLLDQRDDHTLTALRVTPLPFWQYLLYVLGVPTLLGALVGALFIEATGLVELPTAAVIGAAAAAAPIAPVYALFLARFASNKVEGFALAKAVGVIQIPPVLAWWVDEPWQWLFGLVPYYFPAKVVWSAAEGGPVAIYVIGALASQAVLLWLLLRHAERWLPD